MHLRWLAGSFLLFLAAFIKPVGAQDGRADELRRRHAELAPALAHSEFGRPLLLESAQEGDQAQGIVLAVLEAPMARVLALAEPSRWCDVLMLHPTTRRCQVQPSGTGLDVVLAARAGLWSEGVGMQLDFQRQSPQPDRLDVQLSAERGPLGTHHYRIRLEAVPLSATQSFMRLSYSYAYGLAARLALQTYLHTRGRDKVGFSRVPGPAGQAPQPVGGLRGVIERNTMRYFLGIEVLLQTLDLPPAQEDLRLKAWFDATERYARQLHELDREEYLQLKRTQLGLP